jgi:hypothetical protein
MNIDEKILRHDGLINIWELIETDNLSVTFDVSSINLQYAPFLKINRFVSNDNFLINGISFFKEDCIVHKDSVKNTIHTERVSELYNLFKSGVELFLLKSDDTFDKIETFEYYEIKNASKFIKHIHFYFGRQMFVFYSEKQYLIKTDTYYI